MPPPAKRVKATTYRRDSHEIAKLCFRLIAEIDARPVGDSHRSCYLYDTGGLTHSPSRLAWSEGRRPIGAVLYSSYEPGELSQ